MSNNRLCTLTITLISSCLLSNVTTAQEQDLSDGVYTLEQVQAGNAVYKDTCGSCHDIKFYRDIWKGWVDQSLLDFWTTIVSEMPSDNPGSLLDDEYTGIVANILSEMKFPAGDTPLDPYDGMDNITIIAP